MAKSVDKIVKELEKLSNQLQACVVECGSKMSEETTAIAQANVRHSKASNERDRAMRIRDKIKELIK